MNSSTLFTEYFNSVVKLRNKESIIIIDRSSKVFYRFRINPDESRLFWMKEASLDRRNWVSQNHFLSLKDVVLMIHRNKIDNQLFKNL